MHLLYCVAFFSHAYICVYVCVVLNVAMPRALFFYVSSTGYISSIAIWWCMYLSFHRFSIPPLLSSLSLSRLSVWCLCTAFTVFFKACQKILLRTFSTISTCCTQKHTHTHHHHHHQQREKWMRWKRAITEEASPLYYRYFYFLLL